MSDAQPEMQMPQPTAEHELLMKSVGTWDVQGKFWMAPLPSILRFLPASRASRRAFERSNLLRFGAIT